MTLLLAVLPGLMCGLAASAELGAVRVFYGMCDASAVVTLDSRHFAIASDEDNVLRVYALGQTKAPVWRKDLSAFLEVPGKAPETDLEAAARVGDMIYWMSSHGRNAEGKARPARQRFFATRIIAAAAGFELKPEGLPCKTLLPALLADGRLAPFNLAEASTLAPKVEGALDIEGLAAMPDGALLIGFRNPVPRGQALLVPLKNPADVVRGEPPRFGEPLLLDLGGLGVRDVTRAGGRYLILAGAADGKDAFRLYEWSGPGETPRLLADDFHGLHPEGISAVLGPDAASFLCVSDDGNLEVDGCPCKELKDPAQRRFRLVTLKL